jgi:CheY-like chemotaxis protein
MSLKKIAGRALEILHVEDNAGDAALLKHVLKNAGFPTRLSHVPDGETALLFLGKKGPHAQAPQPDVVLLDLKLPKKGGLDVLVEIRKDPQYQHLPVIILTNSDSDLDMSWATRFNATQYIVKPMDPNHFDGLVKQLRTYWIKTFHKQ